MAEPVTGSSELVHVLPKEAIATVDKRLGKLAAPSRGLQEVSEANAAALDDLRDLHKSGVPVRWPT